MVIMLFWHCTSWGIHLMGDYLNFALGTAGIEEGNMVKTMNTMLDYFAASLEDENLQELLSLTY